MPFAGSTCFQVIEQFYHLGALLAVWSVNEKPLKQETSLLRRKLCTLRDDIAKSKLFYDSTQETNASFLSDRGIYFSPAGAHGNMPLSHEQTR